MKNVRYGLFALLATLGIACILLTAACKKGDGTEGTGEGQSGGTQVTGGQTFALSGDFATVTQEGLSGGTTDAMAHSPECVGMIAENPDHIATVEGTVNAKFAVTAEADTTLVILGPGGPYCNDDGDEGLNPDLTAELAAGEYQVFVGNYDSEEGAVAYTLTVTHVAPAAPPTPVTPPTTVPTVVPTTVPAVVPTTVPAVVPVVPVAPPVVPVVLPPTTTPSGP